MLSGRAAVVRRDDIAGGDDVESAVAEGSLLGRTEKPVQACCRAGTTAHTWSDTRTYDSIFTSV